EGGSMRGAVDAKRRPRDDREAAIDEPARRLDRDVLPVTGRRPGTDDRDRQIECTEQACVAAHPECGWRVRAEVVKCQRPLGVARDDESRVEARRLPEVQRGVDLPQPRLPAGEGILEGAAGELAELCR